MICASPLLTVVNRIAAKISTVSESSAAPPPNTDPYLLSYTARYDMATGKDVDLSRFFSCFAANPAALYHTFHVSVPPHRFSLSAILGLMARIGCFSVSFSNTSLCRWIPFLRFYRNVLKNSDNDAKLSA